MIQNIQNEGGMENGTVLAETVLKICEKTGMLAAKLYVAVLKAGGCVTLKDFEWPNTSKYTAAKWLVVLGYAEVVQRNPLRICLKISKSPGVEEVADLPRA